MNTEDIVQRLLRRHPHFRMWLREQTADDFGMLALQFAIVDMHGAGAFRCSISTQYRLLLDEIKNRVDREGEMLRVPSEAEFRAVERLYLPMICAIACNRVFDRWIAPARGLMPPEPWKAGRPAKGPRNLRDQ
jgi:hypothetical protein